MRGRSLRPIAAAVLVLAAASGCKEESGIKVTSFTFNGTKAVKPAQLRSVLATSASSKLPWGEKHYFSREQFEADLKRIVAFYQDRGYPDARVTSFDVKLDEAQTSVRIALDIDEGQPLVVERVDLTGLEGVPEIHRRALETKLPLKVGHPLDRALLQASREAVLDELKDHGYPYASVRLDESNGSDDHHRAIALTAEPGTLAHYGPIQISGNSSVGDDVIRRQLTYRPGQLYRRSQLQESQRQLYSRELFQFANVEPLHTDGRPAEIPTRVTVTEGKHRKVNFGIGYGSEEKARAQADWRHVNFFGGARTAGVLARYSSLDRGVRLSLNQPYVFSPRYSLDLSGQSWHTDEPAFTLDTNGIKASVSRQFARVGGPVLGGGRPTLTFSAGYALERESYSISNSALEDLSFRDELIALGLDPRTGTSEGTRSALSLDVSRNTTNNLLDARHGYVANAHLEQAGKWLRGTYDYYELTAEGRFYQTIAGRAVIAVLGHIGSIDAFGDQQIKVPFFKRYFLGGATNLRGWGRYEVSPLSGFGLPIGGTSFLNFSAELRAPLWGNLGAVLFVDGGNVWVNAWDFNLNDMRYDVGPGLRYNTKIGPIRADLGYQLNPIPGLLVNGKPQSRRFRFHFSIGQAF